MVQFSKGIGGFVFFVKHGERYASLNMEIPCFIDINVFLGVFIWMLYKHWSF